MLRLPNQAENRVVARHSYTLFQAVPMNGSALILKPSLTSRWLRFVGDFSIPKVSPCPRYFPHLSADWNPAVGKAIACAKPSDLPILREDDSTGRHVEFYVSDGSRGKTDLEGSLESINCVGAHLAPTGLVAKLVFRHKKLGGEHVCFFLLGPVAVPVYKRVFVAEIEPAGPAVKQEVSKFVCDHKPPLPGASNVRIDHGNALFGPANQTPFRPINGLRVHDEVEPEGNRFDRNWTDLVDPESIENLVSRHYRLHKQHLFVLLTALLVSLFQYAQKLNLIKHLQRILLA